MHDLSSRGFSIAYTAFCFLKGRSLNYAPLADFGKYIVDIDKIGFACQALHIKEVQYSGYIFNACKLNRTVARVAVITAMRF